MSALQTAVEGILNTDVDLFAIVAKEQSSPVHDSNLFVIAEEAILDEYVEAGFVTDTEEERMRKRMERVKHHGVITRRRILDTLIAETGGHGVLRLLNLDRGWDVQKDAVFVTFGEIMTEAFRSWLDSSGSRDILRKVRKEEPFASHKIFYEHTARFLILQEVREQLKISIT